MHNAHQDAISAVPPNLYLLGGQISLNCYNGTTVADYLHNAFISTAHGRLQLLPL